MDNHQDFYKTSSSFLQEVLKFQIGKNSVNTQSQTLHRKVPQKGFRAAQINQKFLFQSNHRVWQRYPIILPFMFPNLFDCV